ncbi:MAG: hypothetical protein K9N46_01365 [Candidatus Marinimicrobia bacterium]|nr:hypothetical protein [Candidatus Neomarinimicrobiota bacterium]MCF7827875.1 hypothetical protein [Candidatus Neomarinimicrobiota bacterium]MCF7879370.1 hypothetical protein [Candidatus Neomarinimicrobiota bacterium]
MSNPDAVFTHRATTPLAAFLFLVILIQSVPGNLSGQIIDPDELIADTLHIPLEFAQEEPASATGLRVTDNRKLPGCILDIHQIDKYLVIPVDQYLTMDDSLSEVFHRFLGASVNSKDVTLQINHLDLWYDSKPFFAPGWMLNAETRLVDKSGDILSVWQWEEKRKPARKEALDQTIAQLMREWLIEQQSALITKDYHVPEAIRPYRRVLRPWVDMIVYPDGYAIDARLSLYYPADQQTNYLRGVPSIYYRNSSERESVAIGGNDLQWYHRLSQNWLARVDGTFRLGFNQFNEQKFDHVPWYNLFLVNLSFAQTIEWRPQYYRGVYAGIGLHQSVNILPEVTERFEPGILVTIGARLP